VVEKTSVFIKQQASTKTPFNIYAALTQIHPPFLPHPDFKGRSLAGEYADIQMQVDHYVGQIIDALDEAGVADHTIVILTGDNAAGEHSINWCGEGGSNEPWRGATHALNFSAGVSLERAVDCQPNVLQQSQQAAICCRCAIDHKCVTELLEAQSRRQMRCAMLLVRPHLGLTARHARSATMFPHFLARIRWMCSVILLL